MKPTACPLPEEAGLYWLRVASMSYDEKRKDNGWSWENPPDEGWLLAYVDPKRDSDYKITSMMGSDEIAKWNGSGVSDIVVIQVHSRVMEPSSSG